MSLPYSHVFLRHRGLDGKVTYLVPAGKRAIVNCIDTYTGVGAGTNIHAIDELTKGTWWWHISEGVIQDYAGWQGRQVFDEGEEFSISVSGDSAGSDIRVSGFLLSA